VDEKQKILLAELIRGAEVTFANAEQLFQEASLLRGNRHFCRSIFLHQIAMEECAKVELIGAAATSITMGYTVNLKALGRAFRDHKAKNFANAYMATMSEAEIAAREANDPNAAGEAFRKIQKEIHDELNMAKNASMYVDFVDDRFVAPTDIVSEELALQTAALNYYFMSVTAPRLRAMRRLVDDQEFSQKWVAEFVALAHKLREQKATMKEQSEAITGFIRETAKKMSGGSNGAPPR
jgi:AbiV family abortive infection protein